VAGQSIVAHATAPVVGSCMLNGPYVSRLPNRVEREPFVAPFGGAQHVRTMADDERRAARERGVGEADGVSAIHSEKELRRVLRALRAGAFGAKVHRDDDDRISIGGAAPWREPRRGRARRGRRRSV
jgi:hypothetical protein